MNSIRPRYALAFASLIAAGCSTKDSGTADSAAVASAPVTAAPTTSFPVEPTANDISNYKLDMDKMRKYSAAIRGFATIAKTDSSAADAMSSKANESTVQMIAKLEGNPTAMRVLNQAGLSARDYVWITAAWLQAAMTHGAMEANPNAKLPEGQNPQNVQFIREHKAELEAMTRDIGAGQ
jgi:hypothetical protein